MKETSPARWALALFLAWWLAAPAAAVNVELVRNAAVPSAPVPAVHAALGAPLSAVALSPSALAPAAGSISAAPAAAAVGEAPSADVEALLDAYQDGSLAARGVPASTQEGLARAADRGAREALGRANFKISRIYGAILGTRMYEAPELPGVMLKTYGSPFYIKGRAFKGYTLAKERLGDLFADTTILEDVTVTINGRRRDLPWVLVQEKVQVEDIQGFGRRSTQVLLGMLRRGVRDNDRRQPGVDPIDINRNLGEAPDGRFVHFDADFFAAEKDAEEDPKRVRDPPVLQKAIRAAQRLWLAAERLVAGDAHTP